jgi:alkanesulfonate monooxygenase SsuD/methylene tetrahydromethanopterin reductase-like flavin-dependent oxidoreductase (luciferase family)
MKDYGHDLLFGVFVTPVNQPVMQAVDLAIAAERAGLDLVTFQDHPYQPRFHDTWTLLTYVAARTERIRLSGNVLSLPLRNPAALARSAASLDLLSGGRFELGMGAGIFWDAIEAMGGRRLTPGQSIEALEEAIRIIRGIWATDEPGGVRLDGRYYRLTGAKRGPAPAHDIEIWVGAYRPRNLRLTGRAADGWLPSFGYVQGGLAGLDRMNQLIDAGAEAAGRHPRAVRRLLNVGGSFSPTRGGLLDGPPAQWVDEISEIALEHGISGFILASDDQPTIDRYAAEVAPAVRERVASERGR